uniref:Pfam-B_18151 domain containing protein n=1 Tax=Echinococcus granulosus TaxID=6210 RepID=A0A068WXK7_ECHGR|nr:Pfam-B_18151 domain containing protein [Echinococcus granulosus]
MQQLECVNNNNNNNNNNNCTMHSMTVCAQMEMHKSCRWKGLRCYLDAPRLVIPHAAVCASCHSHAQSSIPLPHPPTHTHTPATRMIAQMSVHRLLPPCMNASFDVEVSAMREVCHPFQHQPPPVVGMRGKWSTMKRALQVECPLTRVSITHLLHIVVLVMVV